MLTATIYFTELLVSTLLRFVFWIAVIPTLIFLEFVYYARLIPGLNPFGWLTALQNLFHKIDPFLSQSLGDVQRYMEHGAWAASIRGSVERAVLAMYEDRDIDDITIIAHSLGCVITYDALAEGGRVASEVARLQAEGLPPKKITFVTLGSAINQFFRGAQKSTIPTMRRFSRPLDPILIGGNSISVDEAKQRFFWLDIVSRWDPVSIGKNLLP